MASKPLARGGRFGWLLLLCSVSAVVNLSLVAATGERDFLALAIVPIVLTGMFFSGKSLLFTTAFLYLANAAYMSRFYEGGSRLSNSSVGWWPMASSWRLEPWFSS
jgi:hypothetical protein